MILGARLKNLGVNLHHLEPRPGAHVKEGRKEGGSWADFNQTSFFGYLLVVNSGLVISILMFVGTTLGHAV